MKTSNRFVLFITLCAVIVPLAACTSKPAPTTSAKVNRWSSPPTMQIDTSKQYTATIKTNKGDIEVQLFASEDPLTVNNFVFLARQGFYDGVIFHRILQGFVIQTGDPTGTGSGGPGYQFADEKVTRDYLPGTLAMANSGPNTNGSQFFICLSDLRTQLAKNYTIFGIVTSGMDVVQTIAATPVKANPNMGGEVSSPTQDVHMISVTITEK